MLMYVFGGWEKKLIKHVLRKRVIHLLEGFTDAIMIWCDRFEICGSHDHIYIPSIKTAVPFISSLIATKDQIF